MESNTIRRFGMSDGRLVRGQRRGGDDVAANRHEPPLQPRRGGGRVAVGRDQQFAGLNGPRLVVMRPPTAPAGSTDATGVSSTIAARLGAPRSASWCT